MLGRHGSFIYLFSSTHGAILFFLREAVQYMQGQLKQEIQRLWNAIFFFVLFSPGELVDYFELLSADLVLFGFTNLTHTHKVNNKIKTESVLKTDM